jgi:hypothetical protein
MKVFLAWLILTVFLGVVCADDRGDWIFAGVVSAFIVAVAAYGATFDAWWQDAGIPELLGSLLVLFVVGVGVVKLAQWAWSRIRQ